MTIAMLHIEHYIIELNYFCGAIVPNRRHSKRGTNYNLKHVKTKESSPRAIIT